jgi:hypothetical protein
MASSYEFDELDQAWLDENWPTAAKCTCLYAVGDVVEFFPEHCALPEHREAATREAS